MTTPAAPLTKSSAPTPASHAPFKRSARNYLIDRSFQLKYTGYIVALTLVVSVALGGLLYRETARSVALGDAAVAIGAEANRAGRDAVEQSKSLTIVIEGFAETNYKNDPALLASMKEADAAKQDDIRARARALEDGEAKLKEQRVALAHQRTVLIVTLSGALGLLVLLVGLGSIVVTHKVAGPIFKMKRLLGEVGEGRLLIPPGQLRKGDELHDFFDAFARMVVKLRDRQGDEIALVDRAIADARAGGADATTLDRLATLREHMQEVLDRT